MSPDLDTKIRNYGDQLDRKAVSLETLTQRAVSTSRPRIARRPRWALATGAAAVLVVAVGGVAVLTGLFGAGGGTPIATAPEVAAVTLQDGTWQRTVLEADLFVDMEGTSFGLVAAAGQDGIWISKDGQKWDQVFVGPHEPFSGTTTAPEPPMTVPPPPGEVETYIRHIAEYEGSIYAAAVNVAGANGPDMTGRLIVYRSEDGVTWEETVVIETSSPLQGIHPADLLATDTGLVIYGEPTPTVDPALQSGTAVYRSEDGQSWTEVDSASTGLASAGLAYGVTPYSGGFIAVADLPSPDEGPLLGVYRSTDGITWEPISGVTFGGDDYSVFNPTRLVEHEGVLFLSGLEMVWETGPEAAVWRSSDGTQFERLDLETEHAQTADGFSTPFGLLVVGWSWESDPDRLVLLASSDGYSFLPIEDQSLILDSIGGLEQARGVMFGDSVLLIGQGVDKDDAPIQVQWTWTLNE